MTGTRVVFPAIGMATLESFDIPALRADEVLAETLYSAVSAGTERANLLGMPNTAGTFPRRPGYCAVARVVACGADVSAPQVGERVLVYHGGHATHSVMKAEGLVIVPEEVDSLDASLVIIASMALQGVRKTRLELGESAMVVGLGLLGMFAVQLARLSGAMPALAVDYDASRRALACTLGADAAFAPDDPALAQTVHGITRGRMVDAIVEVTGASAALSLSLRLAARQARVSLLGCTRVSEEPIDFYQLVHKPGISIIGAHNFVRPEHDSYPHHWTRQDDYRALLDLLMAGRLKARPMISAVTPFDRAPAVYARLAQDACAPLGTVFAWQ